jgi:hypothetical protein
MRRGDDPLNGVFFFIIFVSITIVIIGLNSIFFPENILTFGICLIICGVFLSLFDIGMMGIMCGPSMPIKIGWGIFMICIVIIIYGLYLLGSGSLQYLGIIL